MSIEVAGLSKHFRLSVLNRRQVRALDNVSFHIKPGRIAAVLGLNGAGKTTLLKILSTLIIPDSGACRVCGCRLGVEDTMIKKSIGAVFHAQRSFYWRLTGRQNLDFFASLYALGGAAARRRIQALLDLFNVDYADRRFDSYSSGMQQTLALIRALVHEPAVLLLDEPTRSLDHDTGLRVHRLIREMPAAKKNTTVLFTTHRMDEAAQLADEFIILHRGQLRAWGDLECLRKQTDSPQASLPEIFQKITKASYAAR